MTRYLFFCSHSLLSLRLLCLATIVIALGSSPAHAKSNLRVEVAEPYINIRTGAGKSYPIHYVAQRGQLLTVLKRKAFWYKIKMTTHGQREIVGWVYRSDLGDTVVAGSSIISSDHPRMNHAKQPRLSLIHI